MANLTCTAAVKEAVRILHQCHDDAKDNKEFEIEVSWVGVESGFEHQLVPEALLRDAEEKAKEAILAAMDYE